MVFNIGKAELKEVAQKITVLEDFLMSQSFEGDTHSVWYHPNGLGWCGRRSERSALQVWRREKE
jgi:hypothetical protein